MSVFDSSSIARRNYDFVFVLVPVPLIHKLCPPSTHIACGRPVVAFLHSASCMLEPVKYRGSDVYVRNLTSTMDPAKTSITINEFVDT